MLMAAKRLVCCIQYLWARTQQVAASFPTCGTRAPPPFTHKRKPCPQPQPFPIISRDGTHASRTDDSAGPLCKCDLHCPVDKFCCTLQQLAPIASSLVCTVFLSLYFQAGGPAMKLCCQSCIPTSSSMQLQNMIPLLPKVVQ